VSDEVREFGAQFSVDDAGDAVLDQAGDSDIRKGDPLMDEESASGKMSVECVQRTDETFEESCVELSKAEQRKNYKIVQHGKVGSVTYRFIVRHCASHKLADQETGRFHFGIAKV
jgi:hypothetical protein